MIWSYINKTGKLPPACLHYKVNVWSQPGLHQTYWIPSDHLRTKPVSKRVSLLTVHESALKQKKCKCKGDQDSSLPQHANLPDQRAHSSLFKPVQISTRAREEIQPHRQEVAADDGDVFSSSFIVFHLNAADSSKLGQTGSYVKN